VTPLPAEEAAAIKSKCALALASLVAALALPAEAASPPGRDVARLERHVAALQAKVANLQKQNAQLSRLATEESHVASSLKRHIASVDPCPITVPTKSTPPGAPSAMHGNGKLWISLWESNIVVWPADTDGSIHVKFGWWRGVAGKLRVEGRRLDGVSPALAADVPDGYGDDGFQPVGITFPTEGCWEVTGRVADASLTFITLVLGA